MNSNDFIALTYFIRDTMIQVFGVLDGITIVEGDGYRLSLLMFGLTVGFLMILIGLYKKITE